MVLLLLLLAGGSPAIGAWWGSGARRRRGSRELSSLAAGGARDRASGRGDRAPCFFRGDRAPWWLPAWRLHEMLLGRGLADSISSTQGPVLVSACPIAHDFSHPARSEGAAAASLAAALSRIATPAKAPSHRSFDSLHQLVGVSLPSPLASRSPSPTPVFSPVQDSITGDEDASA